jgi:deazaflavin-dependent oxidoreductase (nitroreductase family)
MPLPQFLPAVNRRVVNPVSRRFAGRLPPFAIVVHMGRTSGKEYHTPILAFRSPTGFAIALTYGPKTDWVRNVLAAGTCTLEYRRVAAPLANPRLVHTAEVRQLLPAPIRLALRLLHVDDFLLLDRSRT